MPDNIYSLIHSNLNRHSILKPIQRLTVTGAQPSYGQSQVANELARELAKDHHRVLFVTAGSFSKK